MKKRLIENYATSLIGVFLILLAAAAWYTEKRGSEECVVIAGWGFTFLRSKDSIIGIDREKKEVGDGN